MRFQSDLGKIAARTLLHGGGGLHGVRYWNRHGFRILMYHNFASSAPKMHESLARQCAHLTRHYTIVTLSDIARSLRERTRLPPNAVAVTVDDGYQDFMNGYPVFHAYKIPVTVFLVSGFLDRTLWMWWDKLAYLVEHSPRPSFDIQLSPQAPPTRLGLETPERRRQTVVALTRAIKKMTNEDRGQFMAKMPSFLEVDPPLQPPDYAAPLDWLEVRRLAQNSVEFGAHTITHPILARIGNPQDLHQEIWHSKQRIEAEIHKPVNHFSYPYGFPGDFNGDTVKTVHQCLFETAVTTEKGLDSRGTNPFRLKRIGVEPTMSEVYFKELLAGLHVNGYP